MIPGEDAQAARIVGHGFRQPEFHAEVGDAQIFALFALWQVLVPGWFVEVCVKLLHYAFHIAEEMRIARRRIEPLLRNGLQHRDGVVVAILPLGLIQVGEQRARAMIPVEGDVVGYFFEPFQFGRKAGHYLK